MIVRGIRVLLGFIVACLAAAFMLILFVYTPADLLSTPSDMRGDRLAEAGLFALVVAPHVALFSAPFVLVGVIFAELRALTGWAYYVLVGVGVAVAGFLTQHFSEAPGQATILQNYALIAFLVAGFVGGLVYWYFAGCYAGPRRRPANRTPEVPASNETGPAGATK